MKNLTFIIFLCSMIIFSCTEKEKPSVCELDYDSDKIYYKLNVTDSDDNRYLQTEDEDWKEHLLVQKEVFVKDSNFGGMKNIPSAIRYAKIIKGLLPYDCFVKNSINIQTNKGIYKPVWILNQNFYWSDGSFGERVGRIELDEAVFNYKNDWRNGIKIIYKNNDIDGFTLNILNFASVNNYWELVSREQISTIPERLKSQSSYCIDTINYNYEKKFSKEKPIYITDYMLLEMPNGVCH